MTAALYLNMLAVDPIATAILVILGIIVILILIANIQVVPQAKAYVIERLGAYSATWTVGLHFKIPFLERIAKKITLKADGIDEFGQFVATSYTLCGSKAIFGGEKDFDETLTANDMTEQDGVWTKTYEGVQLEAYNEETEEGVTYEYKVAANHAWNGAQYPSSGNMPLTVAEAGKYNLTFTYNPNEETNPLRCEAEYMTPGVPEFAYASGYFTEDVLLVGILTSEADYEAGRDVCVLATVDGSEPSVDALATGATQVLRDGVQVAGDVTTVKALVVLIDENSEEDFPAAKDAKGNYIVSQVVERTYTKMDKFK